MANYKLQSMKKNPKIKIHRFALTQKKNGTKILNKDPSKPEGKTILLSTLPQLPTPSVKLQSILFKFNHLNETSSKSRRIRRKKRGEVGVLTRVLNGFFAFRAFYSKSVFKYEHQKQLSTLLSQAWKEESNKATWETYAIVYNVQRPKKDFFEWLCESLGLEFEPEALQSKPTSFAKPNRVEDLCFSLNTGESTF